MHFLYKLFSMIILGIESTCDETACAIVRNGKDIIANIVSSQAELHNKLGGVMPELACRQHVDELIPVIDRRPLKKPASPCKISMESLSLIAPYSSALF